MSDSRWYILSRNVVDREGVFGELLWSVQDRERKSVIEEASGLQPWEVRKGVDVRTIGDGYLRVSGRTRIGDLLQTSLLRNVVFSTEVVRASDEAGLEFDPSIYRWPLHVVDSRTHEPRRDYVVMFATKEWQSLDISRAGVVYYRSVPHAIQKIKRWAFDPDQTPDYDLFRTPYEWLCSARLKELVERETFTGFRFRRIDENGVPEPDYFDF